MTKSEAIVCEYVDKHRDSTLARIEGLVGLVGATKLWNEFMGETISLPAGKTVYRSVLPTLIRQELKGLRKGSKEFLVGVADLGKRFERSKRAILEMYKTGEHTR